MVQTRTLDDSNTQDEFQSFYRDMAERAVAGFRRKRLNAEYVPDRHAALKRVFELIPEGAAVARGSSVTLDQLGVIPALKAAGKYRVSKAWDKDEQGNFLLRGEDRIEALRQDLLTDVFLSGANALTLDGKVVCLDGTGNRVASLIFGPKKVIIVSGANKIVDNLDEAFKRIYDYVVPICHRWDVMKHHADPQYYLETPCVKGGKCNDCTTIGRGCCYTVIIESAKDPKRDLAKRGIPYPDEVLTRINILIVGENLGI